MVYCTSIGK